MSLELSYVFVYISLVLSVFFSGSCRLCVCVSRLSSYFLSVLVLAFILSFFIVVFFLFNSLFIYLFIYLIIAYNHHHHHNQSSPPFNTTNILPALSITI